MANASTKRLKGEEMGKYSTKKVHLNPKKKKTNKNHKQKYFKKENKKIDKSTLYEVKGSREELKDYVGETFEVKAFLTNTYKYSETKRLLNSVILPIKKDNKNLYINHLWVRSEKVKNVKHGFKTFIVQITEYNNLYSEDGSKKYGVKVKEIKERK
jgi:hypothetical protein